MTRSTYRTLTHCAVVLAATAGLSLTTASASDAKTVYNTDTRGDMTSFSFDDDSDEPSTQPAPNRAVGDIVKTRLFHAKQVGVRVTFAALTPRRLNAEFLGIVTDRNLKRSVTLVSGPGEAAGETSVQGPNGGDIKHCGVSHSIDYDADVVTIRVPRRCLGNPKWVRLSLSDLSTDSNLDDDSDDDSPFYFDDALNDRASDSPFGFGFDAGFDTGGYKSARLFQHK